MSGKAKLSLILGFIALILVCGCSKDDNSTGPPDYFPLTLGNSWTFEVTEKDTAGQDSVYTQIQTVDHTTTFDSEEWFVIVATTDSDTDSTYYRKGEFFLEAIFFYQGSLLDDIIAVSPLEPSVGFSWGDTVNIEVNGVVEDSEEITVPAGTFQCYRERLQISALGGMIEMQIYNWLSDGVGPVRIMYVSGEDTTDMKMVSYSVQ